MRQPFVLPMYTRAPFASAAAIWSKWSARRRTGGRLVIPDARSPFHQRLIIFPAITIISALTACARRSPVLPTLRAAALAIHHHAGVAPPAGLVTMYGFSPLT
ncbi:MAG: hypothetical protein IPK17_15765 [Chloroflexi bacterium]|uniref:hypothetical protein n=1 Tax=Candidatus Flexifilum breve TaxID=3140694 RepID=UPI003136E08E|nr:hypothetical protein [Chloroflexota bacterium]